MATADDESLLQHLVAIQTGTDKESVDAAVRALRPMIERMAALVCFGRPRQLRADFIETALAQIVAPRVAKGGATLPARICEFDPHVGSFGGWLRKVLRNLLTDELRSRGRRRKHEVVATDVADEGDPLGSHADPKRIVVETSLDRVAPFGDHDLQTIEAWPVRDRLRLLAIAGLWRKVPEEVWAAWCEEEDLSEPFPQGSGEADTKWAWIKSLAAQMGDSPEALKQSWHRKQQLLERLTYVWELRYAD